MKVKTSTRAERALALKVKRFLTTTSKKAPELSTFLGSLRPLGEVVIFGGLLRNALLYGLHSFRSDIDLVVLISDEDLNRAIHRFRPGMNAFGGYRLRANSYEVDVWALSSTWAFRTGLVAGGTIEDLVRTTFFNWDAIAFSLESERLIHTEHYIDDIRNRYLDIVLAENPNPAGMVKRALRLMQATSGTISPRLVRYLVEHGESMRPAELSNEKGWAPLESYFNPRNIIPILKHHLSRSSDRPFTTERQLAFWKQADTSRGNRRRLGHA